MGFSDRSVAIYPIAEALMETNIAVIKTLDIYYMALHFCFVPHLSGSVEIPFSKHYVSHE